MLVQHARSDARFVLGVKDVARPVAGAQRNRQSRAHPMSV